MLNSAYLLNGFFLMCPWLIFFFMRKDLRKEMLFMSVVSMPFGILQYLFRQDYFHPLYIYNFSFFGIEDLLWMFAMGGITGVIYEEFFGKKLSNRHTRKHPYLMIVFTVVGLFALFIGNIIFKINSMYMTLIIFSVIGVITLLIRRDLLKHAFYSGICVGLITLIFDFLHVLIFPDFFQKMWFINNVSGVLVLGIPIEELLFAFMLGFVVGPMYEFVFGFRLKKLDKVK